MKRGVSIAGKLALVAVAATLFTGSSVGSSATAPLVIGVATAKSGFMAGFDVPAVAAAEIARDEFNRTGGIRGQKVQFKYCDVKTDPGQSANCATQLISQGAKFLIVSCDYDIGGPASRVAEKKGVISFSLCAGSPKWDSIGPHSYSMTFGSPTEAYVVAQWAYQGKLKCRTAYLLTDLIVDYTKAVGDYIKKSYKGKLVGQDTFKNGDASFAAQVSRLQSANPKPQCIFLSTFPPGGVTMLRQLRAAGLDQPIIAPDGMDGNYWIKAVPNLSDFYYAGFVSIFGDDPNAKVNNLVNGIEKRTGAKVLSGSTAVSGYSVMEAYKLAITRAKSTDTEKVNAQIQKFRNEKLIVGPTTFTKTARQSQGRPMRIIQVQDGKFSYLAVFKPTGVKP
jgi:branched-chain amino acid transport system substrate-binding protein